MPKKAPSSQEGHQKQQNGVPNQQTKKRDQSALQWVCHHKLNSLGQRVRVRYYCSRNSDQDLLFSTTGMDSILWFLVPPFRAWCFLWHNSDQGLLFATTGLDSILLFLIPFMRTWCFLWQHSAQALLCTWHKTAQPSELSELQVIFSAKRTTGSIWKIICRAIERCVLLFQLVQ